MTVDLFAGEGHFLDHLVPVWRALPDHLQGVVYVRSGLERLAAVHGLAPEVTERLEEPGPPCLVASAGDFARVPRRRVIYAEHGAGQTYSSRHPSYAGGIGRDRAILFLVPNHHARRRNAARYPKIPAAVVGCPKLDALLDVEAPAGPPTVAISWHWRCAVAPETGTAFDHFAPVLADTRDQLAADGVRLIGHAHPRLLDDARPVYDQAGIEVVDSFEDVVAQAHVYAVDNSSTLFEFAALARPVVVLNSPAYRRGISHGLRFWSAADVGIQVDRPEELAPALLAAFDDPEDQVRSRARALAEVYPVLDGTSSTRAAAAVAKVIGTARRCLVCGAGACACARRPGTKVVPVDQTRRSAMTSTGPKRLYPNPNGRGYLRLDDEEARRRGLEAVAPETSEVGAPLAHDEPDAQAPRGALRPGGPTARAKARRAVEEAAVDPEPAPPADPAPDTPDEEAQTKKRPAPSAGSRRRRPAAKG